jgi:hypothetical protein
MGEGPWLGGYQSGESEGPSENWHWVTDEPFDYTNWAPQEPSDNEGQNRLQFFGFTEPRDNLWNNQYHDNLSNGYIIEIPEPATILLLTLGGILLRRRNR